MLGEDRRNGGSSLESAAKVAVDGSKQVLGSYEEQHEVRITGVGDVQLLEGGLLLALKEILTDEHSAGHSAPTTGSVRCALRASMMGSCADDASASAHGASNRVCRSVLLSRTHRLLLCRFDICCSSRTWRPREQMDENQQGSDNFLLCSGVSGSSGRDAAPRIPCLCGGHTDSSSAVESHWNAHGRRESSRRVLILCAGSGEVALCVTMGLEHFHTLAECSCGQQNPGGAGGGGSEGWAHTSVMTQGSFVSSPTRGFSACACAE